MLGIKHLIYLDVHSSIKEIASIQKASAIYLSGGNTYQLLQALKVTKADELILEMATKIPIIGVSAGGLCLTKDIRLTTDKNDDEISDFKGLGLVSFGFYPHYRQNDVTDAKIRAFIRLTGIETVFALPEYSGLSVSEDGLQPLGEVFRFTKDQPEPKILLDSNERE